MKLECVKDVIMTVSEEKLFTKGKIYNGYYYSGKYAIDPYKKCFCAKNDINERHVIKDVSGNGLDTFFADHFVKVKEVAK